MKIQSKAVYSTLAILGLAALLSVFQNCAEGLPIDSGYEELQSVNSSSLTLHIPATQIQTTTSVRISATGGVPPYVFSVVSGPATISGTDTLIAGNSVGSVVVRVTDTESQETQGGIAVVLNPVPTPQSCTLPWGGLLAHQASVTAYSTATPACNVACASQTRTCNNGVLSGTYTQQTCSTTPCPAVFKWVNVSRLLFSRLSHAEACSRAGMTVAADQGYGTCASGELRPNQGNDYKKINYYYGTASGAQTGGMPSIHGERYFCYRSGQKTDSDSTDRVVAYLCME